MTVNDILTKLGDNMLCDIQVHWYYEQNYDNDKRLKSDTRDVIIEIFGDCELDDTDSIYFSQKDKNDDGVLDLYIKNPPSVEDILKRSVLR